MTFNANNVEPSSSFEPLPSGDYPVIIQSSEMKQTKAGTGSFLELTLEVIDGQSKGRLIWDKLNLDNPNQVAVDIAQKQLSSICRAVGVMQVDDSSQLHNLPMVAKVKYMPEKDGYDASNNIKSYKAMSNSSYQPNQQQQQSQSAPAKPIWG